jgi:cytochrome P450
MLIASPAHVAAIHSESWRADPYPIFAELRRDRPGARLDWPMRGAGDWLVTRHADVAAALRDPALAISRTAAAAPGGTAYPCARDPNEPLQRTVLTTDGADHAALRSRTARAIGRVTPSVERCVADSVARVTQDLAKRRHFDLVDDFAQPICEAIWCDLMLIDSATICRLSRWSADYLEQGFIFGLGPVKTSAREAISGMRRVMAATLAENAAHDRFGILRAIAHDIPLAPEDATSATNTAIL